MDRRALETELGTDPNCFPVTRLINPHPAISAALDELITAVDQVLGGDDPGL